jgi:small subunit ribosomal protein S17
MADEEKNETEETPPAEEPAAEPEAAAEDASESEAVASEADAEPSDTESAPAEEADASSEDAEPDAPLSPKERRRRARAEKFNAQPARPETSPEERQAERDARRAGKATVRRGVRQRQREKARAARGQTPEPVAARDLVRPGTQKTRQGVVVSDKAAKTITVRINITRRHPEYKKVVRTSSTLHAHDENGDANIGDTVVIRECRPLSRTKRWRLVEVLERAK